MGAVLLGLCVLGCYARTWNAPFLLDDMGNIVGNLTIRHLTTALSPVPSSMTGGRPLLNLSFALNFALGGDEVAGYHVFNVAVHLASALVLLGIYRRALPRMCLHEPLAALAEPVALAGALIWAVHPLQTEAVTYVSQRAESLMALSYLVCFYGFLRSLSSARSSAWLALSVAACLAGTMVKELIVTAPVLVLFFDWLFVGRSFSAIWRQRAAYYSGLAGTWLVLAYLQSHLHRQGVGLDHGVSSLDSVLYSCRTLCLYLKLLFIPWPLILDYGVFPVGRAVTGYLPYAAAIVAMLLAGVGLFRRAPGVAFALLCYLILLAPSHSLVPLTTQPIAEHRCYLASACILILPIAGLFGLLGRRALVVTAAAAACLMAATYARNGDYDSVVDVWADVVAKMPDNLRARYFLGWAQMNAGLYHEAERNLKRVADLDPAFADAFLDLGLVLSREPGQVSRAEELYRHVLQMYPDNSRAHLLLGMALEAEGAGAAAVTDQFRAAIACGENSGAWNVPQAYFELARALERTPSGRPEALACYRRVLELTPENAGARESISRLEAPLKPPSIDRLRLESKAHPSSRDAHFALAEALAATPSGVPEAEGEFEASLKIDPTFAAAHNDLGKLLAHSNGRIGDAIDHFRQAVACDPQFGVAWFNLGCALSQTEGGDKEAIQAFRNALRLDPNNAQAHNNLGIALGSDPSRMAEAAEEFEAALRIDPQYADARANLDVARRANRSEKSPALPARP